MTHVVEPRVRAWWQRGGLGELLRYVVVGVTCTALYTAVFYLLTHAGTGPVLANVVGSVISTVVGSEAHRRVTFAHRPRIDWFEAQWQSAGVALLGLVVTSGVLALVEALLPGTVWWMQVLLVNAATVVVGLGRYLALSGWVFADRRSARS